MRILDRYILSRFVTNLVSSFVILMFIFIFQSIWLFIDDLAGRGLDIAIISKFFFYKMPELTEKVLPLTVLLSSILTFGAFAENYEFAAMKASGISLQRSMLSVIIFVTILGGLTFFFANSVIPASEQKIFNLRRNIAQVKPAIAITEGVFSDFEGTGMNIKVDNKYGENDRFLENVIIHKKSNTQINNTVIKARGGELRSDENSDILQLVLKDGHYYEDIRTRSSNEQRKFPFAKSNFKTYTINIDLSEFNDVDLDAERDITTEKMKNVSRLVKDIDSLKRSNKRVVRAFSKNTINKIGAFAPLPIKDSSTAKIMKQYTKGPARKYLDKDSILTDTTAPKIDNTSDVADIVGLFQDWQKLQLVGAAKNSTSNIINAIEGKKEELQNRYKLYNLHILSLHKKYALAFSCIILFFVGAPLGAIIRKGGLGLPMVIAIVLFLSFYFMGVFAGNYAKEGNIHPMLGAWLSTLIMLPLGIFLTRRATADRGLMGFGNVLDFIKNIFRKKNG